MGNKCGVVDITPIIYIIMLIIIGLVIGCIYKKYYSKNSQ